MSEENRRGEAATGTSDAVRVRWTLHPQTPPRPWLACNRCGGPRPYQSSGRIRLNANGKRLDAWLIYRCTGCDNTWNRPLFERRNVREFDRETLFALETSAPHLVERLAFDAADLRRHVGRIDEAGDIAVTKEIVSESPGSSLIEIAMRAALPCGLRLDRLLATELGLVRQRIERLADERRLLVHPSHRHALRRPVPDGMRVTLEISGLGDAVPLAAAALGRAGPSSERPSADPAGKRR